MTKQDTSTIHAVPTQLLQGVESVTLRRGATQFRVSGRNSHALVKTTLNLADGSRNRHQLANDVAQTLTAGSDAVSVSLGNQNILSDPTSSVSEQERFSARALIDALIDRRFLIERLLTDEPPKVEDSSDVFYWQLEKSEDAFRTRLGSLRLAIVGDNSISRAMTEVLKTYGVPAPVFLEDSALNNGTGESGGHLSDHNPAVSTAVTDPAEFVHNLGKLDLLIATCDFGDQNALRPWNRACFINGIQFMSCLLRDSVGAVGPLVVPGETSCLECARARWNSNSSRLDEEMHAEEHAFEGRFVNALLPSFPIFIAHIAMMELIRFFCVAPHHAVNSVVDINLYSMSVRRRPVLKVPLCRVCGTLMNKPSVSVFRRVAISRF